MAKEEIKKKKRKDDDEPVKKKKKKTFDVSATDKPKKKRKPVEDEEDHGTELALYDPSASGEKLSLTKTKLLLKTQFGKGAEKILSLIESDDTDPAVALLMKRLLSSVVDVLPYAEMGIRKTKGARGIHGFSMLVSQLRELMVDIQAAQDRGMMGQSLVMQVVQPSFSDLAQDTVLEFSTLSADVKSILNQEDYEKFMVLLKESRGRLANKMTHHYKAIESGTINFLQR